MSIRQIRNTVLIAAGVCVLAVAGIFAGRLSADAIPGRSRVDFAQKVYGRLSQGLDLTADQKTAVKGVLRTHSDEIVAQLNASRAARKALRSAVMTSPTDEAAIRQRAAEVGRIQADGAVLFARMRAEVDPILTPEQRERARAFQSRAHDRGDSAAESLQKFLNSPS